MTTLTAQQRVDRGTLEIDLQRQVRDLSAMYGWVHVHLRKAQTNQGWRTPVTGQLGPGWPDMVLVNPMRRRLLFRELKRELGELSPDQVYVHTMLREAGLDIAVWRPSDLTSGRIQAELSA